VFLVAAVVAVAAIVGAVIVSTNSGNRTKSRKKHLEQARIQDSIRAAVRARRDTARQDAAQERSNQLMDELDKMEQRFNAVRQEVVKERPSPAQEKLIGQFRAEMGRVRALAGTIALASEAKADSIKDEVRESERVIRGLISDLSRAPKK
jgi:Flp pilus assembly protein TadB